LVTLGINTGKYNWTELTASFGTVWIMQSRGDVWAGKGGEWSKRGWGGSGGV